MASLNLELKVYSWISFFLERLFFLFFEFVDSGTSLNMLGRKYFFLLKRFDWILFSMVIILISFGLSAIYSVALSKEMPDFFNFKKQLIFVGAGLVLLFIISFTDYRLIRSYSRFLYLVGLVILVSVLIFGKSIRGTTSWFSYSIFNFQPVEVVKLILIIFLARFFSDKARLLKRFQNLVMSGLACGLLVFLVMLQPDFGSALILFILWLGLIMIVGIKRLHLILLLTFMILAVLVSWGVLLEGYQKARIITFFDPSFDPLGRGYNITQSIIAVGSGRFLGRGLGLGSQSQLRFLPEAQTDFIFSVIGEELGFLGLALLVGFIVILFLRIIRIAKRARDDFGLFLTLGILILFFTEIFINIGGNIGVIPVTGVSLPLISYGGSSLVVSLMMVGVLESIAIRSPKVE